MLKEAENKNWSVESKDRHVCLIRRERSKSTTALEIDMVQMKTPTMTNDVTVLSRANMTSSAPLAPPGKRARTTSIGKEEMPIEERLNREQSRQALCAEGKPRASNLVVLLTQGLQSGDPQLLNTVLQTRDELIISNTVRQLPPQVVPSLVKELARRVQVHSQTGILVVRWVRAVLMQHSSYIASFPEVVRTLKGVYEMSESRSEVHENLVRLQGKLQLVLSQIAHQQCDSEDLTLAQQQALLVYEQESSSESEENIPVQSDSEESLERWTDSAGEASLIESEEEASSEN